MKLSRLILLIFVLIFIFTGATAFIYYYLHKPEIIMINMDLSVEDSNIIGMNSDTDALHFGTFPRGSSSTRKLEIANNKDYLLFVNINISGNFAEWVNISQNNFILMPKENVRIEFKATVPEDAAYKVYDGTAYIVLRRY